MGSFIPLTEVSEVLRRMLIVGPPNVFKTASLLTCHRPLYILSVPGEKGWETIPRHLPDVKGYVWRDDEASKGSSYATLQEVEKLTKELIAGKHGEVVTLAVDGLHKLYDLHFEAALAYMRTTRAFTEGPNAGDEEVITGPAYGKAHRTFKKYLDLVLQSPIPYVIGTVWEGRIKDDPANKNRNAPTHIFPSIPGKMGERVVGEFGVVVYAKIGLPGPDGFSKSHWETRKVGDIWGVGIKIDPEIARKIPPQVPQDFKKLEALVKGLLPKTPPPSPGAQKPAGGGS